MRHVLWIMVVGLAGCSHRSLSSSGDGATCDVAYQVKPLKLFACSSGGHAPVPVLAAGDGQVVFTDKRTLGKNSAEDTDLFALRADTGATFQITGDDQTTTLLGVDGTAILYATHEGGKAPKRLLLKTDGGTVDLGRHDVYPYLTYSSYTGGPARTVDGGQAAWLTKDGVYFYDGGSVRKVAALGGQGYRGSLPYLEGGALVWSQWDGEDLEVYLHDRGQTRQLTSNTTPDRHPVVSDGRVFWSCDEDICTWAGGAASVLDEGPCSAPDAHRGSAAWICKNRVSLFDGQQVRRITGGGDAIERDGVRLHDGRLIWVEIRGRSAVRGTLVFSDTRRQQDVAEVGLPCLACSAYWPPLSLSLSSDLVAWTYATPQPSASPPHKHCAYAEIERRCAP